MSKSLVLRRAWWAALLVLYGGTIFATQESFVVPTKPGTNFRECARDCPLMVVVPAGTFIMGTDRLDVEGDGREGPPHTVTFERPFAIGVYDVTRAEFAVFIRETGYRMKKGCNVVDSRGHWITDSKKNWREPGFKQTDRDPVVCVSWNDAQKYVSWLDGKADRSNKGHGAYRLPSEAEWEYAARAGSTTSFYWGPEASHEFANYGIEDCSPCGAKKEGRDQWYFTSPVGSFPPNAFGLYDASGNVWQWTEDCTHYSYNGAPADGSAWTSDTDNGCYNRIVRGGSWLDPSWLVPPFVRNPWAPDDHNNANGFRVARSLDY